MQSLLEIVRRHKSGEPAGIYSVCSAHPLVIEAALVQARADDAPFALIEATSNQVNQDGGYTGMVPADFRDFVLGIADRVGLDRGRVALGGDHLGPNAWQKLPPEEALAKAEVMIAQYVEAGFRKIHLDCSMSCAGDPVPLSDQVVAERAARLCAVAEAAHARAGGEPPVYVVGTEVPVPGGAHEDLDELAVTTPAAAHATIEVHRRVFEAAGLGDAWPRVIATVVQPGVEFDHHKVVDYRPERAVELSDAIETERGIVFEAHSTDYQTAAALAALVRDHFAILKVGPGVTFALREALWALDAIERDLLGEEEATGFREVALERMRADPANWEKYYEEGPQLGFDLQYSFSDRIRYYWPDPAIAEAQARLFANLARQPIPLALISQYLPTVYPAVRDGSVAPEPHALVIAHIRAALVPYSAACGTLSTETLA